MTIGFDKMKFISILATLVGLSVQLTIQVSVHFGDYYSFHELYIFIVVTHAHNHNVKQNYCFQK